MSSSATSGSFPAIDVSAGKTGRLLTRAIAVVVVLHLLWMLLYFGLGHRTMMGLSGLLNLDNESGIGTWASVMNLAITSVALFAVAIAERGDRFAAMSWFMLGFGFLYLSIDELVEIHEHLARFMAMLVGNDGIFHHTWIALAIPVLVVLAGCFIPFLRRLEPRYRWPMIGAGLVYVGGAVGVETLTGALLSSGAVGRRSVEYAALVVLEESMELLGPAMLLRTLLRYARERFGGIVVRLGTVDRRPHVEGPAHREHSART